ncbi:MAG: TAXI family TRAP transporter solute-binding subunit [Candidatus Desulforudis sp.]|nr:TAXI family TRAP transporter solute-binding subunit [Desulforudis sp.]
MRKPSKFAAVLLSLLLVAALVVGCGGSEQPAAPDAPPAPTQFISIATGGQAGTYFPLGGAMAEIFNANVPGIDARAETTNASVANISLLEQGQAELAFIQNDISYYAYEGIQMFDSPVTNIAGVATLYPEVIQVVTLADKGINSIEDLKGKKVAVGAPASGTEANARQILAAYGMTFEDITEDFLSFGEAAGNLKDGHVDAAFLTAGLPTGAVLDLGATHDIKIISLSAAAIESLTTEYAFYAPFTIEGGTYAKMDEDVATVAVKAMLVTTTELSEEMVYNLTKALFDNLDAYGAAHERGKDLTLETATEAMSLPLHPGAAKFYEEKGIQ